MVGDTVNTALPWNKYFLAYIRIAIEMRNEGPSEGDATIFSLDLKEFRHRRRPVFLRKLAHANSKFVRYNRKKSCSALR